MPRDARTPLSEPIFAEPTFNEPNPTPDPQGFVTAHPPDSATYNEIQDLLKKDVVSFPKSRMKGDDVLSLGAVLGSSGDQVWNAAEKLGQLAFHALGDSGASNAGKYASEITVADQITSDCHTSQCPPAFLYHLGDVVYDFGEAPYYYDQFYDPYRNYPRPIFAIPGNHDSFVVPNTPPGETPLEVFSRNFCAEKPTITSEARSLHRTAMTQPGVYFALDAPFVRIIGLFSNALEDPGVISSERANGQPCRTSSSIS